MALSEHKSKGWNQYEYKYEDINSGCTKQEICGLDMNWRSILIQGGSQIKVEIF